MDIGTIFTTLISEFGPWAIVCFILYWFTQHTEKQDNAHADEVTKLTDAINNMNLLLNNMNVMIGIIMDNMGVDDEAGKNS